MQQSHFRVDTGSGLGSPSRTNKENENEEGVCVTLPGAAAGAGEAHPGGQECGGSEQDGRGLRRNVAAAESGAFAYSVSRDRNEGGAGAADAGGAEVRAMAVSGGMGTGGHSDMDGMDACVDAVIDGSVDSVGLRVGEGGGGAAGVLVELFEWSVVDSMTFWADRIPPPRSALSVMCVLCMCVSVVDSMTFWAGLRGRRCACPYDACRKCVCVCVCVCMRVYIHEHTHDALGGPRRRYASVCVCTHDVCSIYVRMHTHVYI